PLDAVFAVQEAAPVQAGATRQRDADPLGSFLSKLSSSSSIAPTGPKPALPGNGERSRRDGSRREDGKGREGEKRSRGKRSNGARVEISCAACGTQTTVPFEPTNGRPVYCRSCYAAMRAGTPPATSGPRHDVSS